MARLIKSRAIKGFIVSNKVLFVVGYICIIIGIVVGVCIGVSGESAVIFSSSTVTLEELITGEYSSVDLVNGQAFTYFSSFFKILLPIFIIFVFSLNKFTGVLDFIYLMYQGLLLGLSATGVIQENGLTGALNTLIFISPVNLINLTIINYASALFIKRREYAQKFHKNFVESTSYYTSEIIGLIIGVIISSFLYGVVYPTILKSMIIINY